MPSTMNRPTRTRKRKLVDESLMKEVTKLLKDSSSDQAISLDDTHETAGKARSEAQRYRVALQGTGVVTRTTVFTNADGTYTGGLYLAQS